MLNNEIYFNVDIEANGPIPGPYSMLSLGCAAFSIDEKSLAPTLIDTFSVNFETLTNSIEHPSTMEFWSKNKEAFLATRNDIIHPKLGMERFFNWVQNNTKKYNADAVCVGQPAGFDFTFLYWYLINFLDKSPFSFSCIDAKTYAMAVMKKSYRKSTKRNMPKSWFADNVKHTHIAVEDAIEQGYIFCNMMKDHLSKK